jgi:hypothetical protein
MSADIGHVLIVACLRSEGETPAPSSAHEHVWILGTVRCQRLEGMMIIVAISLVKGNNCFETDAIGRILILSDGFGSNGYFSRVRFPANPDQLRTARVAGRPGLYAYFSTFYSYGGL